MAVAQLKAVTFKGLKELMNGKKNMKIGHNTAAADCGNLVGIKYHNYPIAVLDRGNSMIIDHFGWVTVTTSGRLHQIVSANYPGAGVNIRKGMMVYTAPSGATHDVNEGLAIDPSGEVKE